MKERPADRHCPLPTVSRLRRAAAKIRTEARRSLRRAGMLMAPGSRPGRKHGRRS